MFDSYPYGKDFELACLALLVQEPQDAVHSIEPQYFTTPAYGDIARIVGLSYEGKDLRSFRLKFRSLWPLVLDEVGLNKPQKVDLKPIYHKAVRQIFNLSLPDKAVLLAKFSEWTRKWRFRETLVKVEKDFHENRIDRARERVQELATILAPGTLATDKHGDRTEARLVDFPGPSSTESQQSRWLIQDLIPDTGLAMGVGVPGAGKSLLALLMLDAAVRGVPFLNRKCPSRRFALYVDAENGRPEMARRCSIFNVATLRLRFWCLDDPKFGVPPKDPLHPVYLGLAEKYRCPIVFDPFHYFAEGKVNQAEDVAPVLQKFKELAVRGRIPVYVLHHSSDKDPKNTYIGSTLIRAILDAGHFIKAKKDRANPDVRYITISSLKARRTGDFTLALKANWRTGEYEEWQSPNLALRKKLERILEQFPDISERDAAKKLGVSRWKLRALLGK